MNGIFAKVNIPDFMMSHPNENATHNFSKQNGWNYRKRRKTKYYEQWRKNCSVPAAKNRIYELAYECQGYYNYEEFEGGGAEHVAVCPLVSDEMT